MSVAPLTDHELERLAIFPLHGVTLFPNTLLPLHVFEPRYRQLIEHCLEGELPLGVWQLDPSIPTSPHGPAIRRVATAGRIVVHHRLGEGRFNVVVEGVQRVRFLEELPNDTLYRTVRTARHPLLLPDARAVQARLDALEGLAWQLHGLHPRAARLVEVTLRRTGDPHEVSDVLCSVTFGDGHDRQRLLEQSDVTARLDRVIDSLSNLLLRDLPEDEAGSPLAVC